LSGNTLGGIGTLCHEFGHVMGLPDLYDTDYGTVYDGSKTPNDWDVMDGGSYNADGHCPPNYDPWEKDFFGWHTPINLGSEGQNLTLYANGTENYQADQINTSGNYVTPTTAGLRYYIENRQAQGWDAPLTGHGMLIWKINFNATAWTNNAPNNSSTSGAPLYTIVSATGTKIGWDGSTDNCPKNTFPGSKQVTSYTGITGKPLLNIKESNQIVTLTYIEEPAPEVDPFELTWKADGKVFAKTTSTGKIVLPENEPTACEGKVFVGWTATENYLSDDAPAFVKAGAAITEPTTFYAVFATQDGEGGAAAFDGSTGGTFKIYAQVGDTKYYATSTVSNNKLQSTTTESEAADFVLTPANDGGFSIATDGKYLSNGSKTNVSLSTTAQQWNMESGTQGTWRVNSTANTGRALVFRAGEYNVFGAYSTSNINGTEYFDLEIGGEGGASYSNYSTSCGGETAIEDVEAAKPAAFKTIREGRIVIVRGDEEFNITGERIR
jgi:flavodoxin